MNEYCPYCGTKTKIWEDFPSKDRYYQYCRCGWGRRIPKELAEKWK